MLIKFLRSSFASQYVALVFMALMLWFPAFQHPDIPTQPDAFSPVYNVLFPFLSASPLIATIIAFLLVIVQAFYFNAILASNQLIGRVASAGAFVFVLLFSLSPAQTTMYPLLLALPFILASIHLFFNMFDEKNNETYIFNAAFQISLASLLYFPSIILFFWLFTSLFILRITSLREWIIPFVGLITPYFFLATVYFMMNVLFAKATAYSSLPSMISFDLKWPGIASLVLLALIIVIVVQSIQIVSSPGVDRNIAIRKKKAIMNALFFISLLMNVYQTESIEQNALYLVPFAVYISFSYMVVKKYFWPQLFLLLLIFLSLFNHFLVFLK